MNPDNEPSRRSGPGSNEREAESQFQQPFTAPPPSAAETGFRSDARGFVAPTRGDLEETPKVRALYGATGFGAGVLIGLVLGLLNSVLEGIKLNDGLGLTIQFGLWFGAVFGAIASWRPRRFEVVFERIKTRLGV